MTQLDLEGASTSVIVRSIVPLVNLTSLNLSGNVNFRGDTLHQLSALRVLNLARNTGVRDNQLSRLTALTALDLTRNPVISWTGVSGLTNLRTLVARDTYLTNGALIGLTQLTDLDVRGNPNVNDAVLRHLPALLWLTTSRRVASAETRDAITSRGGYVLEE